MKKLFKSLIVAMLFALFALRPAFAADSTTIVLPGDLATGIADVISNPAKWYFYNDETDVIDNSLGSFVLGPGTTPLGSGSVQISVTGSQRRNIATYQFSGTPLSSISTLKFSTYNPSAGNGEGAGSNRSGYLHFNVDFDGSDTWQNRLVYVPSLNGTITQDSWQEWNAVLGASNWLYSGPTWPITGQPGTTPKTWSQILTDYPTARIRVSDSFLGIRVGEPYANGYTENIDALKFGTSAGTTTFDFELNAPVNAPVILTPAHSASIATSAFTMVDWTDATGGVGPYQYRYEAYSDPAYATLIYNSGFTLATSQIATPGTPPGEYYLRVMAKDSLGVESAWSNGSTNPHHITVTADVTPTPIPNLPAACTGMTIANVINGSNRSEVLNGTSGNDFIYGVNGADVINGNGGDDCILTGNASSVVSGGAGNDVLVTGNGSDSVSGGDGTDMIWTNGGSDYATGGAGADEIHGGNGSDVLSGDADADKLFGDGGSDVTLGGADSDTCTAESKVACEL